MKIAIVWISWMSWNFVRNSISKRCWKFQLSILKNKKVLFLKKVFLAVVSKYAKRDPKDGVCCLNFPWRFWVRLIEITHHVTYISWLWLQVQVSRWIGISHVYFEMSKVFGRTTYATVWHVQRRWIRLLLQFLWQSNDR